MHVDDQQGQSSIDADTANEAALDVTEFEDWFAIAEPRLRASLVATFGAELGRDAAAEALSYAWQHRDKVLAMENPLGYAFRVGQRWAVRQSRRNRRRFGMPVFEHPPAGFEPALHEALAALPERQRQVVVLCTGYGLSHREAADVLGISSSTVQNHADRGLAKLRKRIGS